MTSEKQAIANRSNALKSTGPKSKDGKSVVSANAIQHGILSPKLLVRDEIQEEFDGFKSSLLESLAPKGSLEELLTAKLVLLAWRLRRVVWVESDMLNGKGDYGTLASPTACFSRSNGIRMQNVSRYESSLEKHFYRALNELQRVQAFRKEASASSWDLDSYGLDSD